MTVKKPAPPPQVPVGAPLPRTYREMFAEKMKAAEVELRAAQAAVAADGSNENRARYADALAAQNEVEGMFPFIAAGAGDEEV